MLSKFKRLRKRAQVGRLFFTGFTMGTADLVPGVSGGTIALLFGIYDELLYAIKVVTGEFPKLLLRKKFKQAIGIIPFKFILPVGLGITTAILGLVKIVSYLLDKSPIMVWAFFFGLVLGSAYVVSRRIKKWNINLVLILISGFLATYIIVGLPAISGSESPLALFASGAIAVTAMVLPGISGSLILVLLGQYEIIINAVASYNFVTLSIFGVGMVAGLALLARLLTWLLKRYHFAVIAFLVGTMLGSLRKVWPWKAEDTANIMPPIELASIGVLMLGFIGLAGVLYLSKLGVTREHNDIDTKDFNRQFKEIEGKG